MGVETVKTLKGQYVVLEKKFNLRGNARSPEHCLKPEKVAVVKQYEMCHPPKSVCLFSHEAEQSLFSLFEHEDFFSSD